MTTGYRVAFMLPVANEKHCAEKLTKWIEMGYDVHVLQDRYRFDCPHGVQVYSPWSTYKGWPASVAYLCRLPMAGQYDCIVTGGDDMLPDPNMHASEIAAEFYQRFPDGFGVMQPIGDDMDGTDRICGSPWFGRGWIERSYCGRGPLCGSYFQFYADEELLNVARGLGVLWQRQDLTQYHDHWTRRREPRPQYQDLSQSYWDTDKATFMERLSHGFPGSHPKPARVMSPE